MIILMLLPSSCCYRLTPSLAKWIQLRPGAYQAPSGCCGGLLHGIFLTTVLQYRAILRHLCHLLGLVNATFLCGWRLALYSR